MDVQKILWPTDLSGSAKQALKYGQTITEQYQVDIYDMYIIEDIAHHRGLYGNFTPKYIASLRIWDHC